MDEWKTQKARAGATSIAVDASQKAESAFSVETGKALAKRFDEMVGEGDAAAQNLEVVADLRRLGTGIGTGAYAVVQSYLGKLGVKTEGLSQIEAYNALIDRLTPQQRLPGSGATSDFDAKMFKGSLTSLMNTPEGNALIVDSMERIIDNRMKRGDIALRVQTGELSQREGLAEIRKLQAQARDISTAARDFGKPKTPTTDRPGAPTAPGASSPKLADPLGIR
jgi:flagellar protein FlgJ